MSDRRSEKVVPFQERPMICLCDVEDIVLTSLQAGGFNCTKASFGSVVDLPLRERRAKCTCLLNHSFPNNLHEYDVIIVDMKDRDHVDYKPETHKRSAIKENRQHFILCEYPQNVLDPRPFSGVVIRPHIEEIEERESLIIVFADALDTVKYEIIREEGDYSVIDNEYSYNNYAFLGNVVSDLNSINKQGEQTVIAELGNEDFRRFLQKYNSDYQYSIVFNHPTAWDKDRKETVKAENFIPLILNATGGIVSFGQWNLKSGSILFVFPQMSRKAEFLLELFQRHLPSILPSLFPFSTLFAWLKQEEYRLPGESRLLAERRTLEEEHKRKISDNEKKVEELYHTFRFLQDMLTQTGTDLVKAVELFLHWLGFNEVLNCDEQKLQHNEEDLQVILTNGLLIVEVKGIGGTSKDEECSQINKIKYRRAKERSAFDVYALYIVNHQRYLPPDIRANPPFTPNQIKDAVSGERGLLTTYDLFKAYFAIEDGFITKESVRDAFLQFGLVTFEPSGAILIGIPNEIHHNGFVGIFTLHETLVRVESEVLICENGKYRTAKIVEIQIQGTSVNEANDGEVGIKFSDKLTRNSTVWKRINET